MKLAITGGTGLVGRFVVEEAIGTGDAVTVLSRNAPAGDFFSAPVGHLAYTLGDTPPLDGFDAVVHCAFAHLPGHYRGGEGDDPQGFLRSNLDGTLALIEAAEKAGVARFVFLSSRAVYDGAAPGSRLTEDMPCTPTTLYGQVKLQTEEALRHSGMASASLRATGVYGPAAPGRMHKWRDLFDDFASGRPVEPRVASEVHGADLAQAVRLVLAARPADLADGIFNVSDFELDRRDLLAIYGEATGYDGRLPPPADATGLSIMATDRIRSLGWRPRGHAGLRPALAGMEGRRRF